LWPGYGSRGERSSVNDGSAKVAATKFGEAAEGPYIEFGRSVMMLGAITVGIDFVGNIVDILSKERNSNN
jgi:hypothetical protein